MPALVYRALSPRIWCTILHIKQLHSRCALVQWTYASYSAYPSGDVIVTAVFPLGRTAFRASERSESFCLKTKKVSGSILLCKSHYLHWVRKPSGYTSWHGCCKADIRIERTAASLGGPYASVMNSCFLSLTELFSRI